MRLAFFGTPDVAVPALEVLAGSADIAAVVTNPDRPRGRSGRPRPPPVKESALALGLEVWQPARPTEIVGALRDAGVDACAIVAYGAILPDEVLRAGGRGFVNLHFSLLPRWRGAAPVQHALRAGDAVTGVTAFVLDAGMDTGPVLAAEEVAIDVDETAGDLLVRLADIGAPLLRDSLAGWLEGRLTPVPQPADGASIASKLSPADCAIDWTLPATSVRGLVHASNPSPGAHTNWKGKRLKLWRARVDDHVSAHPGTIVAIAADGPVVATGAGAVVVLEVQPQGKPRMAGEAFANGYQPLDTVFGA